MVNRQTLVEHCAELLGVHAFEDYCPNGLQIQGKDEIAKIVSGVSANQALIDQAIDLGADAILVHHGFFWKNEELTITGIKKNRIKALLDHNINLLAYHLPLDAHPTLGNNAQLGQRLGLTDATPVAGSLLWQASTQMSLTELTQSIWQLSDREPQVFGHSPTPINKIAWCTGAAQSAIGEAIALGADVYISGEVSESTPAIALENNLSFIAAGHHATERYGVQALGAHLAQTFGIDHQFVDIDNIV